MQFSSTEGIDYLKVFMLWLMVMWKHYLLLNARRQEHLQQLLVHVLGLVHHHLHHIAILVSEGGCDCVETLFAPACKELVHHMAIFTG